MEGDFPASRLKRFPILPTGKLPTNLHHSKKIIKFATLKKLCLVDNDENDDNDVNYTTLKYTKY